MSFRIILSFSHYTIDIYFDWCHDTHFHFDCRIYYSLITLLSPISSSFAIDYYITHYYCWYFPITDIAIIIDYAIIIDAIILRHWLLFHYVIIIVLIYFILHYYWYWYYYDIIILQYYNRYNVATRLLPWLILLLILPLLPLILLILIHTYITYTHAD